jgi:AraC-like DNA-binding protein
MSGRLLRIENWEKLTRDAKFQPALMAALCPTSLRSLERFFASQFNQTPGEWVRELRCRLARQLIAAGWSNKAVAAELGFADESHFCHQFKRVYSASPQTFAPLYGTPDRSRVRHHASLSRLDKNVASRQDAGIVPTCFPGNLRPEIRL